MHEEGTTTIPTERPAPESDPKNRDAKVGQNTSRRLWTLGIVGSTTLAAAAIAGNIYGVAAFAAILALVTALCSLGKALIELYLIFERYDGDVATKGVLYLRKNQLMPFVTAALATGVLIGYTLMPWLVDLSLQPSARIAISSSVGTVQQAKISWRNVPSSDDLRIVVRAKSNTTDFIQPCRGLGSRRGSVFCDLGIGGSDDEGKSFEIRVVRMPHKLSAQYATTSTGMPLLASLPEGMQVLALTEVTRN